jgi:hypothetical protein
MNLVLKMENSRCLNKNLRISRVKLKNVRRISKGTQAKLINIKEKLREESSMNKT